MKKFFASLIALALGLGLALASVSPATAIPGNGNGGGAPDPTNSEDYWEKPLTGEVCGKVDKPGGGTLKTWSLSMLAALVPAVTLPTGYEWTKVIIKSGHTDTDTTYFENNGYYVNPTYKYPDPEATTLWEQVTSLTGRSFGHSTNKDISHVIYCWAPAVTTPTDVQGTASVTDQNCAFVDGYITVGLTTGVSYIITKNTAPGTPIAYNATTGQPTSGQTGQLPTGNYTVAVSATSSAYNLTSPANPPSISLTIDPYPANCTPTNVRGSANATNQDLSLIHI